MGQQQGKEMSVYDIPRRDSVKRQTKAHPSLAPTSRSRDTTPSTYLDDHSDPFSRGDCTPGGTLSRTRGHLPRQRLSKKPSVRSRTGHRPTMSVVAQLQAFEELVIQAERRAMDLRPPKVPPKDHGGRSMFSEPSLRRSLSENVFMGPKSAPQLHQDMPPPTAVAADTFTPTTTTSAHRRSFSGSSNTKSRISPKACNRAEREWRAKVAGLAHSSAGPETTFGFRSGPVPPKRTPHAGRAERSDSPASDLIVTPPPPDLGTPAKSFVSNLSFETLGHYHGSPVRHALDDTNDPIRERKVSVPQSVMSLFFFDSPSKSMTPSRPISGVAGKTNTATPNEPSPLRRSAPDAPAEEAISASRRSSDTSTLSTTSPSLAALDRDAMTNSDDTPVLPEKSDQFLDETSAQLGANPTTTIIRATSTPSSNALQVTVHSSPSRRNSAEGVGEHASTLPASYTTPPSVRMDRVISLDETQVGSTPAKVKRASCPVTPLSPTTAYLLSAPIDSIDLSRLGSMHSPGRREHPYSLVPVTPSSPSLPAVIPAAKSADQPVVTPSTPTVPSNAKPSTDEIVLAPSDPFIALPKPLKQARPKRDRRKMFPVDREKSGILQVRKTQPKVALIGDPHRSDLARQREKLRKMGVDLTPGMETGDRPPKSGMPMTDLQRWLMQTSAEN